MSGSNASRWFVTGLLVLLAIAAVAVWPMSSSDDEPDRDEAATETLPAPTKPDVFAAILETDGGAKGRRVKPDCDPVEESLRYESFIDKRALVVLSWNGMPERSADLKIPVQVVGIEDGAVGVQFLQFPMREQYLHIWLGSGHIEAAPEGVFLLDPCSATVLEWPEMERGEADE